MFAGGGIMHYPETGCFFTQSFPELLKSNSNHFVCLIAMTNKKLPEEGWTPEYYLHSTP